MKVSVVVVTYRRTKSLESILAAWLAQTPDVWLADCTPGGFATTLPIHRIHATPDPGNRLRHAVALLTSGELVIKADDDFMPLPGLVDDFVRAFTKYGDGIYSIHGRTFHGRDYYRQTKLYGAKQLQKTQPVQFVGVCTCAPRSLLAMDLLGCNSDIEDLFWQMQKYPKAKKYVIATQNFRHLPESKDAERLCGTRASRVSRNKYYERWYVKNYRPPDRMS